MDFVPEPWNEPLRTAPDDPANGGRARLREIVSRDRGKSERVLHDERAVARAQTDRLVRAPRETRPVL
jgi:hypothetical protein